MKQTLLLSFLIVFSFSIFGQDVEFTKKNFPNKKSELKEALKNLKTADKFMSAQPAPMYNEAVGYYLDLHKFNPKSAHVNYNIGLCYLNTNQKFKALPYFQAAEKLNAGLFPDIYYNIGRGHHLLMEWDEALKNYKKYRGSLNPAKEPDEFNDVVKKIYECESGKELVKNPVRVWIDNMGANINSEYPDYGMVLTADASEIFFTSRRSNSTGGKTDPYDGKFFEDVYHSVYNENRGWSKATNVGAPINTKGHDAAVALNADGSKMIIYIDDNGNGNLYESLRTGDKWSKPKAFNKEINSPFHEASAWHSPDGRQLYFISERPLTKNGGPKDKDIYIATWDDKKKDWGNIERLPDNINSKYDEDGIYAHPDGKTIYFSSRGHNSMGGYDVFKSVRQEDGTWSEPENLGYPINTPDDDVFFTVAANGRDAYMTSYREDGLGEKDLYTITLLGAKKEPIVRNEEVLLANTKTTIKTIEIQPVVDAYGSKLTILKGVIRDDETKVPLKATIQVVDNSTNKVISEFTSDSETGRYLVSLPGGKDYGIAVEADGYLFHSENFNLQEDLGYREERLDVDLKKVKVGANIALRNVFFDLDRFSLRDASITELNRLVELLNKYPKIRIELSGHTDSRGSAAYNKTLSNNRAKTVRDYLVNKGIDTKRLEFKGYGFDQPSVTDAEINAMKRLEDKEAAHQLNRRTEIKIID